MSYRPGMHIWMWVQSKWGVSPNKFSLGVTRSIYIFVYKTNEGATNEVQDYKRLMKWSCMQVNS